MIRRKEKPFATEVDLCAGFLGVIAKEGRWIPYAETAGWDILMVRKSDGFQIGIQAKLKLNTAVINQAIEDSYRNADHSGPDCRAVLVPMGDDGGFNTIAAYIGITIIRVWKESFGGFRIDPGLPDGKNRWPDRVWHELCPMKRHRLPDYVPDVRAGSPSPIQLTEWKISAIKMAILLERRGYVRRSDFAHIGIDHRRWIAPGGWLRRCDCGIGWFGPLNFKREHPRVYSEIAADIAKWAPPVSLLERPA